MSDVAVVGAGLVGVSLAYELACLGASVTVIDAGHPGRATDAGAGILSPVTSHQADDELWPFLRQAGAHYPALLQRIEADGVATTGTGYGRCGILSVGLRAHEDGWFSPFADTVLRRAPGEVAEITAEEAGALFPPLGPVHRVLHAPGSARVDGRGMAAALREAAQARGVDFVTGAAHGVTAGAGTGVGRGPGGMWGRHVDAVEVEGHQNVTCGALAVAGGAWTEAVGEWLGVPLPVGPTKGQIVHLGVEEETGAWPIVQPLLTHYLVPWPGGRVACGGTFEPVAGFSTSATAAGLSELLPRVPDRRTGPGRRHLPRDPGRAPAHVVRRQRRGGPSARVGQCLGGHGPRRQWAVAGSLFGPGAGPRHDRCRADLGRGATAGLVRSRTVRITLTDASTSTRAAAEKLWPC